MTGGGDDYSLATNWYNLYEKYLLEKPWRSTWEQQNRIGS